MLINDERVLVSDANIGLAEITQLDQSLQEHFSDKLTVQPALTRSLVCAARILYCTRITEAIISANASPCKGQP